MSMLRFPTPKAVRSLLVLLAVSAITAPVYAQGSRPLLPCAAEYQILNRMDVRNLGSALPTDSDKICILADNIKIENLRERRVGGNARHILIIAHTVTIGRGNSVTMQSMDTPKSLDGGSFIILCRQLKLNSDSQFDFNGQTAKGGYGATFLLAAESIDLDPAFESNIIDSNLKLIRSLFTPLNIARTQIEKDRWSQLSQSLRICIHQILEALFRCGQILTPSEKQRLSSDILLNGLDNTVKESEIDAIIWLSRFIIENRRNNFPFSYLVNNTSNFVSFISPSEKHSFPYPPFEDRSFPFFGKNPVRKADEIVLEQAREAISRLESIQFSMFSMLGINTINDVYDVPNTVFVTSNGWPQRVRNAGRPIENGTFGGFSGQAARDDEMIGFVAGYDALRSQGGELHVLFSQWCVRWLEYQRSSAERADSLNDRTVLISTLRRFVEMPLYQLDPPYAEQYTTQSNFLFQRVRDTRQLVSDYPLADVPSIGETTILHKRGLSAGYYLPPTDLLLVGVRTGENGRDWKLGTVTNQPGNRLRFHLEGELQANHWLRKVIQEKLKETEQATLDPGLLPDVTYEIEVPEQGGIAPYRTHVNGNYVSFDIDVQESRSAETMFGVATFGLRFFLHWSISNNGVVQKGQLGPYFLRLNQRTGGRLKVVDGQSVKNDEGTTTAKISFVKTSKGRFLAINPAIEVKPGATISLGPLPLEVGETVIGITDSGVTYDDTFEGILSRFLPTESISLLDSLVISNKIPSVVRAPGTQLSYTVQSVDVVISRVDTGSKIPVEITRRSLPSAETLGSEFRIPVLRLSTLPATYQITGQVRFTDGGAVPLKIRDTSLTNIAVTVDDIVFPSCP